MSPDLLREDFDAATKLVNDIMGEANRTSVMEGKVHVTFQNSSQPIPKGAENCGREGNCLPVVKK